MVLALLSYCFFMWYICFLWNFNLASIVTCYWIRFICFSLKFCCFIFHCNLRKIKFHCEYVSINQQHPIVINLIKILTQKISASTNEFNLKFKKKGLLTFWSLLSIVFSFVWISTLIHSKKIYQQNRLIEVC